MTCDGRPEPRVERVMLVLLVPDHQRVDCWQGEGQVGYCERVSLGVARSKTERAGEQVVSAAEYLGGREEVPDPNSYIALLLLGLEKLVDGRTLSRCRDGPFG
jgi:hypothetical protein